MKWQMWQFLEWGFSRVPETPNPWRTPEVLPIQARHNLYTITRGAVLSMQAYLGAIEFDSRLCGWDSKDVARQRAEFQSQMLAVVPGT